MAIIIRVAYNNKGWSGACNAPGKDRLCWQCFTGTLRVTGPKRDDEVCSGDCWERRICTHYRWGCTPKGRVYGPDAYPGAKVFFVFKQPDGNYTLWGKSTVKSIDTEPRSSSFDFENGYAFIHFNPFEPLNHDKWIANLSDVQLVGAKWLQGRHRYIDEAREKYLDQLIEVGSNNSSIEMPVTVKTQNDGDTGIDITFTVRKNINQKLETISAEEGRTIEELIREAIAGWLKRR